MNDVLLMRLAENPDLKYDKTFCYSLASSLHTFYIKADNNEASLMKILGQSKLRDDIVLMPKQLEMIQKMEEETHCVVSAPTSFGKSFMILEYIKRLSNPLKFIVYVVHTKALASEVFNNMVEYFSEDYNVIDDFENYDDGQNNIAIIVSDGKNMYNFDKNVDLLIVDEAYNLDKKHSKDRFLTIFNCYRILMSNSKKVILLGPFIKDLIGPEATKYKLFRTNYSPVTSTLEEYVINDHNNPSIRFLECIDNGENTIGFINSKTMIYKEMYNILNDSNLPNVYCDDFILWMESYFPSFWMLPKLMRKGVAIYHSSFPEYINLYNLKKFNDGEFKGLLTTSAILEGVNTSAKSIVVYGTTYNNEKLTSFQFFNLCGRAGRLNREIVGKIYNYGDSYANLYKDRCLSLYIGDIPSTPEDKFDEGFNDDSTEYIENQVRVELASIGIEYDEWYEEYKFYFSKCSTLLSLIYEYKKFRENYKSDIYLTLKRKNMDALDKNKLLEYIYTNYIKLTTYRYIPTSQFSVQIVLKELLMSKNNGIDFNLKTISSSASITKNLNSLEGIAEKNQYIVEIMRTGYDYIPYKFYYVSIILNEFIQHDSFFNDKEKNQFYTCFFKRIVLYLKVDDADVLIKLLNDRGMIPPLVAKVNDYIIKAKIDLLNKSRGQIIGIVREVLSKITLTEYEKINIRNIHLI